MNRRNFLRTATVLTAGTAVSSLRAEAPAGTNLPAVVPATPPPSATGNRQAVLDYIRRSWDSSVRSGVTSPHIRPIPVPHTVPSPAGKFKALFYWDTYFTNLGLLRQDRVELARSNCDALAWLVDQIGFVPNSAFVNDDRRSQPPYLSQMAREVYEQTHDTNWLAGMLPRLEREHAWWMQARAWSDGLNRHFHDYDDAYLLRFYNGFAVRRLKSPPEIPDALKCDVAAHLIAEAESGADFTPAYQHHCAHFAPVQLNTLLWKLERNLAFFHAELKHEAAVIESWEKRATRRAALIRARLWHAPRGLFLPADQIYGGHAGIATAETFVPLLLGFASPEEAAAVRKNLPLFEREHGVAFTEDNPAAGRYQWCYPVAWPPATWTIAAGLKRYGYHADARRIAEKYLRVMERFFAGDGHLREKYNANTGQLDTGEYAADPMLGWCAGVYVALAGMVASPD